MAEYERLVSHAPPGAARADAAPVEKQVEVVEVIEPTCTGSARSIKLYKYEEVPKFLQDNQFIHGHYRGELLSFRLCAISAFCRIHNESINIHTHFVGLFVFTGLLFFTLFGIVPQYAHTVYDEVAFLVFFGGCLVVLSFSTILHMFACHSERVNKIVSFCDYIGIAVQIICSMSGQVHFVWDCNLQIQAIYVGVALTIGVLVVYISYSPRFHTPSWRPVRALLFVAFALLPAFPVIQLGATEGMSEIMKIILIGMFTEYGFYGLGVTAYATQFPERCCPGKLDVLGHGHQIHHMGVLLGALSHWFMMVFSFRYRAAHPCAALVGI